MRDGTLMQDFLIRKTARTLHLCNALAGGDRGGDPDRSPHCRRGRRGVITPGMRPTLSRRTRPGLPWVLVPVKGRLQHLFCPRRAAGVSMSCCCAMRSPSPRRFLAADASLVVSRCTAALALARHYGADAVRERNRGLNAAAAQGLRAIRARTAGPVIVIACDLPLLRTPDLRTLYRRGLRLGADLMLCPDESGTGTNAIYLGQGVRLRFRFGSQSLQKHLRDAQRRGLLTDLYVNARIARDIDTPAQLRRWRRQRLRRASAVGKSGRSAKAAD